MNKPNKNRIPGEHRMNRILRYSFPLILVVPMFLMTGCPMLFGPPTGWGGACWDDCWTHCDSKGCKTCDKGGCDVPNSSCDPAGPSSQCPNGSKCDGDRAVCKNQGTCSSKGDCGPGDLCIAGSCLPQRDPCKGDDGCGQGAYCKNGDCAASKKCAADKDCKALGAFVCDLRGTCVPGNPPKPKGCSVANACPGGICLNAKCGTCACFRQPFNMMPSLAVHGFSPGSRFKSLRRSSILARHLRVSALSCTHS